MSLFFGGPRARRRSKLVAFPIYYKLELFGVSDFYGIEYFKLCP